MRVILLLFADLCADMLRYSFDIFDTLLTRITSTPQDIFHLAQSRIGTDHIFQDRIRKIFPYARIWAEFRARRLSGREDVSLVQIYEQLDRDLLLGAVARDYLINLELSVERDCSVPIAVNLYKVSELQSSGYKVYFISDMYLPQAFLCELLVQQGIRCVPGMVYVSGDIGVTKGSGRLFSHLLNQEGLLPEQLQHCGDNMYSDVVVPSRLGIRTDPYLVDDPGPVVGKLRRQLFLGSYLAQVFAARAQMLLAR